MTVSYSQRGPMQPLAQRIRSYFAPVNRNSSTPSIFDAAKYGAFALDAPPAPWLDAGWISNFKRTSATKVQPLRAGAKDAPLAQARTMLDATLEFEMHDWGKLQMALARLSFMAKQFAPAQEHYRKVIADYKNSTSAPEAIYWDAVCTYKLANDHTVLLQVAERLKGYPYTEWTAKTGAWTADH